MCVSNSAILSPLTLEIIEFRIISLLLLYSNQKHKKLVVKVAAAVAIDTDIDIITKQRDLLGSQQHLTLLCVLTSGKHGHLRIKCRKFKFSSNNPCITRSRVVTNFARIA